PDLLPEAAARSRPRPGGRRLRAGRPALLVRLAVEPFLLDGIPGSFGRGPSPHPARATAGRSPNDPKLASSGAVGERPRRHTSTFLLGTCALYSQSEI